MEPLFFRGDAVIIEKKEYSADNPIVWEEGMTPENNAFYLKEDGKVYVTYKDQKIDITDKFKNEFCYLELQDGDTTLYVTAKYKAGFAISPKGYSSPEDFED